MGKQGYDVDKGTAELLFARSSHGGYPLRMGILSIEIPSDVLESARMTLQDARVELAVALFASGRLSMGKSAELARLPVGEFQMLLGSRHIGPHYDAGDARDDAKTLAGLRK